MADKSTRLMLEALARAAVEPAGLPLFAPKSVAGKSAPGLFGGTSQGKSAAQRCKDEGFLRPIRPDSQGRSPSTELVTLTEKGLAYLVKEGNPRQVLEDFVRALESRQSQLSEVAASVRNWQAGFDSLKAAATAILTELRSELRSERRAGGGTADHAPPGSGTSIEKPTSAEPPWVSQVRRRLAGWHDSATGGDCPLPELFRVAREHTPDLTIGRFHDGLRALHDRGEIYLHPWTGPLSALPEPSLALLAGHQIAFYASRKGDKK